MTKTHDQLRLKVDGNDGFMTGFQIGKAKEYKRKAPGWINNNEEIRKILLSAFPKLATDKKQRARAACWARVIHFYYRLRYTDKQTAEELTMKVKAVKDVVRRVKLVAAGRRANGSGPRGGKRGRPRKSAPK